MSTPTYAHDPHCNTVHEAGPEPCPPARDVPEPGYSTRVEPAYVREHVDPVAYVTRSNTAVEVLADAFALAVRKGATPEQFGAYAFVELRRQGFDLYAKYAPTTPGATVYAYRYADDMDYSGAREKGVPATGWLHAGGGPPWRVVISEIREQLDRLHPPRTSVQVYDGDEPTILFHEAWPELFRRRVRPRPWENRTPEEIIAAMGNEARQP